ncbi:hypothetical protein ABEB36_005066 [Hypothenemus hampei]|uniref:Uncharacterized protein n=1 Tax=Hypothenemus hampei TaxID=57062 RepID=A0ABD1EWY7_HYPHA
MAEPPNYTGNLYPSLPQSHPSYPNEPIGAPQPFYPPEIPPSAPPYPVNSPDSENPAPIFPAVPNSPLSPSQGNEYPSNFNPGITKTYYWVDTYARGFVPTTALLGGHDIDGANIYVGRAFHEGDWLPAKVIPDKQVAYVAYNGSEHAKDHFQVLCEQRFDWVPASGGQVPPGAVEGGRADGETLYIGRVHHDGAITVGKVHPSHGVCYVPFDGREVPHEAYEILVLRS